jgi:glycerol-3-phosphate acyltransferase PlsX
MLTIALDAMGGDDAPSAVVQGAALALAEFDVRLLLVGVKDAVEAELAKVSYPTDRVEVVHAPEVIGAHEAPTSAVRRKKDSSMMVGLGCVKDGRADAFVSAGSTGALLTGATLVVGRAAGIERPALGTLLPRGDGFTFLIDSGANVDAKPSYLAQFARMGYDYMKKAMGIERPRVGLVNIGTEEEKGNALAKEAYPLIQGTGVNFIGNVEAREVPLGAVDVAVCDGFVGNILLKYTEGLAKGLLGMVKDELMADPLSKVGALLAKGAFKRLKKRMDYAEVGGAPFLGLNALVVKAHGSSDARAFRGAIRQCILFMSEGESDGI